MTSELFQLLFFIVELTEKFKINFVSLTIFHPNIVVKVHLILL